MTQVPLGVAVEHRRITVGEVTLHCVVAGPETGLPVILLHGFPEFWGGWRRQIPALAQAGFRVVVPDQRGYGDSDKPEGVSAYSVQRLSGDVLGLADTLGADRFCLVGHDWGGVIAWSVAARAPDRVARVAVLNAPHGPAMKTAIRRDRMQALRSAYAGFFQLRGVPEAALRAGNFALLTRSMRQSSRPGTFDAGSLAAYRAAWSQPGALTAMLNWYRAVGFGDRTPKRIRPPALLLWGSKDRFLGRSTAEATLEACDDASVRWFDEATHWLHLEEAEAVNTALIAHLSA